MPAARTETLTLADGSAMAAHVVVPDAGSGPGLVVLQEIFGVNDYVRAACERLAALGYVTLAPDLYHRIAPGLELPHDQAGVQRAMEMVGRLDVPQAGDDAAEALAFLRALPEVTDGAGAFGFCLGGALAYQVAARADPDVAVAYYGSQIPDALGQADDITCPILFHYGGEDAYTPRERVAEVESAAARRPNFEIHVQEDAGHAFDNYEAPMFHQPEAAARAWELTREFLGRTLPR